MLLAHIKSYTPFRLDALGIITILGAPEMDQAFGSLRCNSYFDTLPTIALFVVIGNYFMKPVPGFVLYNITDGIMATDISAWFGRWLMAQPLTWNSSTLFISLRPVKPKKAWCAAHLTHLAVTVVVMGITLAISALTIDAWGIVNSVAMAASGITRWLILQQMRNSIEERGRSTMPDDDSVKVMCTLPTGKAVTVLTTRNIVVNYLLTNPVPANQLLYRISRLVGWICFSCHLLCLGMSALANQLVAVFVLLITSMMVAQGVGVNNHIIAQTLVFMQQDCCGTRDSRSSAYARLKLSQDEEDGLVAWALFPQKRNTMWWRRYVASYPSRN